MEHGKALHLHVFTASMLKENAAPKSSNHANNAQKC